MFGTWKAVVYRQFNPLYKWKQHCIGNGCSNHSSISDDWLEGWDEGCGGHSSTWWFNSTLNFKLWMSLRDSKLTFSKWNVNLIMHYELWRSILKMEIFSVKTGLVIVWHSFSLHYHFCWFVLWFFLKPIECPNRSQLCFWNYLVGNLKTLIVSYVISKKHGDA